MHRHATLRRGLEARGHANGRPTTSCLCGSRVNSNSIGLAYPGGATHRSSAPRSVFRYCYGKSPSASASHYSLRARPTARWRTPDPWGCGQMQSPQTRNRRFGVLEPVSGLYGPLVIVSATRIPPRPAPFRGSMACLDSRCRGSRQCSLKRKDSCVDLLFATFVDP